MAAENARTVKALYEAINARELERAASYAAAGAKTTSVPFGGTWDLREDLQGFARDFPDGQIEVKNLIEQGDHVVAEVIARGTHTGTTLRLPTGEIPATGRCLEIPMVQVLRFREGKVIEVRSYFDALSFVEQLRPSAAEEAARGQGTLTATPAAY